MSASIDRRATSPDDGERSAVGARRASWRGRVWRPLVVAAGAGTFALIVLGGIVRITGSGMGCGDDWPLCNGRLLPPLDLPTLIEYGHRLAAAAVGALVLGLAGLAWPGARVAPWDSRRRLSLISAGLLLVQVMLGAVTVWLELPPATVVLHLGTAMLLFAVLVAMACDAWTRPAGAGVAGPWRPSVARSARAAAGLALVVVLLGALTANYDAAPACRGFPLCNGSWWPAGWLPRLHWAHRLGAYALVAWVLALPALVRRRGGTQPGVRGTAALAAVAAAAQLGVGAAMVLGGLPAALRAAHVGLGTAVFGALVALARLAGARRAAAAAHSAPGPAAAAADAPVLPAAG